MLKVPRIEPYRIDAEFDLPQNGGMSSLSVKSPRAIFSDWVEKDFGRFFMFIRQRLNQNADAEEIAQEALTKTLAQIDSGKNFESEAEIRSYTFTIAKHLIIDRSRKASSKDVTDADYVSNVLIQSPDKLKLEELNLEEKEQLEMCLERLDPAERMVVEGILKSRSHQEISEEMEWTSSNVSHKALSKARKKLIRCMEVNES